MKRFIMILAVLMWVATIGSAQATPIVPAGFVLRQVSSGLGNVFDIYRDSSGRLLVINGRQVEQINSDGSHTVVSSGGYYNPLALLVDNTGTIFVADAGPTSVTGDTDGLVWKDTGGGPVPLSTGYTTPTDMVFDPAGSGHILVSEIGGTPPLLALGDAGIFDVNPMTGARVLFFNDGVGPVASNLTNILGLATDTSGNVYASDNGTRNIHRITSFSTQTPLIAGISPFVSPFRMAFDSTGDLFVTDSDRGIIFQIASGSSTAAPFITNVSSPTGLWVQDESIYFTEFSAGSSGTIWQASPVPAAIPEPGTVVLLSTGLLGLLGCGGWRRGHSPCRCAVRSSPKTSCYNRHCVAYFITL